MEFQDPEAGEAALAELTGIQFGVLSMEDTVNLSVFERNHSISRRDLWDSRLGVFNLRGQDTQCGTCGAKKAAKCDGHFGHVKLPMPIYHPLHIRFLRNLLGQICLVCHRIKEKKTCKKGTIEEEYIWREIKRECLDSKTDPEADVAKKSCSLENRRNFEAVSMQANSVRNIRTPATDKMTSRPESLKTSSNPMVDVLVTEVSALHACRTFCTGVSHKAGTSSSSDADDCVTESRPFKKGFSGKDDFSSTNSLTKLKGSFAAYIGRKGCVLPSGIKSSDDDPPSRVASQRISSKPGRKPVNPSTFSTYARQLAAEVDSSDSSDDEEGCKYCGKHLEKSDDRYPKLVVTLSKNKETSHETIEMKACAKEEEVPLDYWDFVNGHAGGCKNIRPLFPFEALQILQSLPGEVVRKLGMDELVARPESLILRELPVPPSGSRIMEPKLDSSLPRVRTDRQQTLLQRLLVEVKSLRSSIFGKPGVSLVKKGVMELQALASEYLTGSKWEQGLKPQAMGSALKNDVKKEDKYMKSHILAKINNVSARLVVVGDPFIKIQEISVPIDLVEELTIPEKVTAFNIARLQQYVDNGPHADYYRIGASHHDRPGREHLHLHNIVRRIVLEIGDTVHRHLKDGDMVIVNRPPSLTKHSLMAMKVRLHLGSTLAINPLICSPFQADFDGDCLHLFVPQCLEALAEVQELMNLPAQLISPQGGQSNNALTEDSRLGAYVITSTCLFLDKVEMSQLTMSGLASLPIPAIVKSPKAVGPLWTGQQLYSMMMPKGFCFTAADKRFKTDVTRGIFIKDGELLVCNGDSSWLSDAPNGLTAVISKNLGPAAAVEYLSQAQELANLYLRDRGFSIALHDYQLSGNRIQLLRRRLEEVARGNREALLQTLLLDEHVQRQELSNNPTSERGFSADTKCCGSKGLYLGASGIIKRVESLDKVAISRFQTKFGQTSERLAKDYLTNANPLFVMIKAGSKGSMSKLVQQTICLGLQLYKGEHLLPRSVQDLTFRKELTSLSTSSASDLLQFEQGNPVVDLAGYWESRGIITSSYLDGLSPLQFFTHTIATRYGMLRADVEKPNLLLKRLLYFLRDLHVAYDGSVRSSQGQQIVQFDYGGLLETAGKGGGFRPKRGSTDWCEAGEPVGILAATAITEPAYQLKLDSPHMIGAKAIGPLDLIFESLNSTKALKLTDRRVLLRMPHSLRHRRHGQEHGAMKIQQQLKPVTLDMVTSTTMIEYRKIQSETGVHGRKSPWVAHIRLSLEKLTLLQVSVAELLTRLEKKYSKPDVHRLNFSSSNRCHFGTSLGKEGLGSCIHFFLEVPSFVGSISNQDYHEYMSHMLEAMKNSVLPILLRTPVKGDGRIQSVNLLWENKSWSPRSAKYPLSGELNQLGDGELVVEVTVKRNCKLRGKAWEIVKEACVPIMLLLDWKRCTPYSVKEIHHVFGLEAAKGVLLQRLELAVSGMGKGVKVEHLKLIADSMSLTGEVSGASLSGFRDLCKSTSHSAPFTAATFQSPKNSFLRAGREGASESLEGAVTSSVWGKTAKLGTGSSFEILWQAGADPSQNLQKGTDIHYGFATLNNLLPAERCSAVPVFHYEDITQETNVVSKTYINHTLPTPQHMKPFPSGVEDDGQRFTRTHFRTDGSGGQRRHLKGAVASVIDKAQSQPTDARKIDVSVEGRQDASFGLKRNNRNWRRRHQDPGRRIEKAPKSYSKYSRPRPMKFSSQNLVSAVGRLNAPKDQCAGPDGRGTSKAGWNIASDDAPNYDREAEQGKLEMRIGPPDGMLDQVNNRNTSERQVRSPVHLSHPQVRLSVSVDESLVDFRTEAPEDSSSFHTPNESLETGLETHDGNSSPCSRFRENPQLPPTPDRNNWEDDQMSGISQPPRQVPHDEAVKENPRATVQRSNDPSELKDLEGCGSVSPFGERPSRKMSNQNLQSCIKTARLSASEDALERRKQELQDEWKQLLHLANTAKFILHRKYKAGERLGTVDQALMLDKVLQFHPDFQQKVGCGVHYIKVDYNQNYLNSRCFYIVRTDNSICDISYHKSIKGFANAKSPALALRYDHEVFIKHERDNCSELDLLDSPDLDPLDLYPSWPPISNQEPVSIDLNLLKEGGCNQSKTTGSKHKEESSCETSELKPGVQKISGS